MKGKERCRILKEIRQEIAENNDIELVTSECQHKGDCLGTCPRCEAELRYLERELEKRRRLGKTIVVAGLTASIALTSAACVDFGATAGDMLPDTQTEVQRDGEIVPPELTGETEVVMPTPGDLPPEDLLLAGVMMPPETDENGELVGVPWENE